MEERRGFLADEVEAAAVVDVVDVVPGDALGPVLLLQGEEKNQRRDSLNTSLLIVVVAVEQELRADAADSLDTEHLLTNLVVVQSGSLFVARAAASRNNWRFV